MTRPAWIVCAAFGATVLAIVLATREERTDAPKITTSGTIAAAPFPRPPASAVTPAPELSPPIADHPVPLRPPALALDSGPLAWEQQLAAAEARERDSAGRARALFALLPSLPEEALATAAERAVEQLPHANYAALALPMVTNPQTPGQVMRVLFAELMERPDSLALPALLSVAQNPTHPYAPAALDNLRLLLGANFGTDWLKWDEAVRHALTPK